MAIADNLVLPILKALRDCLCAQLYDSPLGPACRCMVVHNFTLPVMDGCDCACPDSQGQGDAWVRLVRLDPDGQLFGVGPRGCPTGWQAAIELGTYRCVEVPGDREILPQSVVDYTAAGLLGDMHALIRTVACCSALDDYSSGVEFYSPVGPEGGCAGGVLQIRVALPGGPGGCP
jgi:hypothetical protein